MNLYSAVLFSTCVLLSSISGRAEVEILHLNTIQFPQQSSIHRLTTNNDGSIFATAKGNGFVSVVETSSNRELYSGKFDGYRATCADIHPTENVFIYSNRESIKLVYLNTKSEQVIKMGWSPSLCKWSKKDNTFWTSYQVQRGSNKPEVKIQHWDAISGKELIAIEPRFIKSGAPRFVLSADESLIFIDNSWAVATAPRGIDVFETATGKFIKTLMHNEQINSFVVANANDDIIVYDKASNVNLISYKDGSTKQLLNYPAPSTYLQNSIEANIQLGIFSIASYEMKFGVFDINGTKIFENSQFRDAVMSVTFTPDGSKLFVASYDGQIEMYSVGVK